MYPYLVSTKYNDTICSISLYLMVYQLIASLNIETIVSMYVLVNSLIIINILIVSCWKLISNVVSIEFPIFTDMDDKYQQLNWIKTTAQSIINEFLIILAVNCDNNGCFTAPIGVEKHINKLW